MDAYNSGIKQRMRHMVWSSGCSSWYLVNGRNTQNWVGYMTEYGRRLRKPELAHYSVGRA